ncbi:hypothetical protein AAMO2058_001635500 [Amorphochlora amoebiformis]
MEFGSSPPLRSCAPAPKETSIRTQLRRLEVSSAVKGVLPPPLLRLVLAYDAPVEWQQAADVALPSIRSWVKVVSALQPRKIFLVPTELWASSESIRVVSFDGELLGCVRIPPSIRWVSSAMATADGGHLYLVGAASGHAEAGALGMLAPAESVILRCDFARGGWEHVGNMQPFRSRALLRPCLSPSGARLCVLVGAETDDEFDDVTSENTAPLELMLCETKRSQWSRIPQLCSQGWAPHSAFAFSPDGSALYAVDYQPMRRGRGSCRTGGEGGGARAARFDFALGRWTELAPMRAHIKNAVIAVSQGGVSVFNLSPAPKGIFASLQIFNSAWLIYPPRQEPKCLY